MTVFIVLALIGIVLYALGKSAIKRNESTMLKAATDAVAQRADVEQRINRLRSGAVAAISSTGIVPLDGEKFFFSDHAQIGAYVKGRAYQSSSPALYVPLGHGFRARVATSRGTSMPEQHFMWGPNGRVFLSNKRLVFKAANSSDMMSAPYTLISSYEKHSDGLEISVKDIGIQQLRTGSMTLGEVFQFVIEHGVPAIVDVDSSAASV